ncbi:MAG: permease [Aquificaceae bacterium]
MFEIYEHIAQYLVYSLLGMEKQARLSMALEFFIYDTLKIFTLLTIIIFVISFIRSYFPIERTREILSKNKAIALPLAALLGVLTPFCSCSAVPMFIGFVEAGIPLSAAFTFLVASPMVNEVALGMLLSLFGLKVALVYLVFGVLVALFSGFLIGKLDPRRLIESYVFEVKLGAQGTQSMTMKERIDYSLNNVKQILGKVWIYIIVAIFIGGFIHGYVPKDFVESMVKSGGFLAVPLATLIGIPLYSNSVGVLPVVQALISKGVPIGTALAFMMATTALSLPEFIILKQIMKPRLIGMFAAIVGISIIIAGYLINFLFQAP